MHLPGRRQRGQTAADANFRFPRQPGFLIIGEPVTPQREPVPESRANSLDAFRAKPKRPAIHPLEKAALAVISLHLVALPWMLGSTRAWAQCISLGLAMVGFVIALTPRRYTDEQAGSSAEFRLVPWPKLIRFPIFWIGLALLAYVTLQALNPAWKYVVDARGFWWMEAIEAKSWLPRGVIAPFEKWNQWRMLVIYASGLLTVCSIWVAFTRRRTVQLFLIILAVNGLLLGLLGVAQRMTNAGKIYWLVDSPNPLFFSSFIYKNHGAIYLFLTLAITCGLASWYYLRGVRRFEKSNPSGVFAFFATCLAIAITISYARAATLVTVAFLLCCVVAFVIHQFLLPKESRRPAIAIALLLVFGYFMKTGLEAVRSDRAWERMKHGLMGYNGNLKDREESTKAAIDMLHDFGAVGAGAGSFRYLFTIYQYRNPKLVADSEGKMFWEYAHNDIVQYPIELGLVGTGLLILGAGYWVIALIRAYFWENPLSACMIAGALAVVVYSWWDFPLQCPAILITWCALWTTSTMWARFEERGAKS